jgi:hypothetical protein
MKQIDKSVNRIIEHTNRAIKVVNETCDYQREPDLWASKVYNTVAQILFEEAGLSFNEHHKNLNHK